MVGHPTMSDTTHAVDRRPDSTDTSHPTRGDEHDRPAVVRTAVPQGDTVVYVPGRSADVYHHTRRCFKLLKSDRDVLEWTPDIAERSGREPCDTCAGGVDAEADT